MLLQKKILEKKMFKSGFVTVVGRSNVGKSTLLNHIMEQKLSIVTNKAQTTRSRIQLIFTNEEMQVIFIDTPGIQKPKNKLGEYMLDISESALKDVDIITYVVDISDIIGENENYILEKLQSLDQKIILVINKMDLVSENKLEEIVEMYKKYNIFESIIPISALNGRNIHLYLEALYRNLEEGPMFYPEDAITDQTERTIVSELIREKALLFLKDEIPHGITVTIESMKERNNRKLMDIDATIVVEKKSHKGMVIGKGGKMIQKIGSTARVDIEKFLDEKVNLQLWVKIDENWRANEQKLKRLGFHK